MAISTNGAIITRVTSALYGEYLSNASYTELKDTAPATVAANFMANDFAGKTDLQVATTILTNLGLTSITGLDNWLSAQLTAAGSTAAAKGAALVSILNGYAGMTADATYGSYATSFNAKVSAGLVKSQTAGNAGGSYATADVVAVTNATIALTTGLDTGAAFTGGAGDDTFNAVDNGSATTGTLTSADSLVGGAGTDTLSIAASDTPGAASISTSGIEVLSVINNDNAQYTLAANLMSGLNTVRVTAGTDAVSVTGATAIVAAEVISSNQDLILESATAVIGTADSTSISLNAVGTGASSTASVTYNGIETFNVALTGAVSGSATNSTSVTLVSDELETVVVTGSVGARLVADLTGADAATQTATFDASAATGSITATITKGGSGKLAVTGGSGNDSFTVGSMAKEMTVDGGTGTDTLVSDGDYVSTSTVQVGANVTGFEKVNAGGSTVDQRAFPSNSFVESVNAGTYEYLDAGFTTANISTVGTVVIDRATDTSADALTINITAATGSSTVTASEEETIAFVAGGTTTGRTHTVSLSAADLTTLTLSGTNSVDLGTLEDSVAVSTINASALTGVTFAVSAAASNVAVTILGSAGVPTTEGNTVNTLTGGSKADSITGGDYKDEISGGLGADTLIGGAGNDSLTGGNGADNLQGGSGNDTINGDSGDDLISGGDGNDLIDAGSGTDTVDGGAGNDNIVVTVSDNTSVDGGTGTDRLAAITGTITSTSTSSVNSAFITVSESAAPTLTSIESAYISINADASTGATDFITLDMTDAAATTSLFLETADAEPTKVTNFAGTSIKLYGGTNSAVASDSMVLDGVGQAALTVTLEAFAQSAATASLTVTGAQALTVAGRSTSQFTGSADQDNYLGDIVASSVDSLTISSSGSSAANADALIIDDVTATAANTLAVTVGAFDNVDIDNINATGDAVETLTVTVGTDGIFDVEAINMDASVLDTVTINVQAGAIMNLGGSATITTLKDVDLTATTISDLTVTLGAGAEAHLDLSSIGVTSGTLSVDSAGTLTLVSSLGATGAESSFVFSGRGDVDFDDGTTVTANAVTLVGSAVTFNTSGLTVESDGFTVVGTDGADTISTGIGGDTITGGAGNDVMSGGAGADTFIYTATSEGSDTISGFVSGTDVLTFQETGFAMTGGVAWSTHALTATANANNYAETATVLSTTAQDLDGTQTTTPGFVVVGAATGTGGVKVYWSTDIGAATTTNSTLMATLTGINTTEIAATDLVGY